MKESNSVDPYHFDSDPDPTELNIYIKKQSYLNGISLVLVTALESYL
jgi:hypothetical protein